MQAKLLRRKRIRSLLEGMFDVPLFVVVSSMGYGKTTAVRDFLASKKNLRHVWFSVRPGESDEQWTWQRLCQSLHPLDAERAKRLAEYGLPKAPVDLERVSVMLGEISTERTVLVVDDYHENKSEFLDSVFTALARASMPHFHVVLLSRTYPNIPLDELMLKGLAGELTQASMEFTSEETARFFALNGFDLTPEEETVLNRITDGWTAAIYLALLKYAEDGAVEDTRSIARLMRTAVFDTFDEETRRILLQLSLLDSFTIDGAVFVTGDRRAAEIVRRLADNNCFVRYEPRSGSYEFHSILKATLQEAFPVSMSDPLTLLLRCGDWCVKRGELIQAIDFYRRAGAHEKILDVFELPGAAELIDRAPSIIVSAFDDMNMDTKLSRPLAYITFIYSYLVVVDAVKGAEMLYEANARYEADTDLAGRQRILGEIALAESFLQFNDVPRMIEYHKKAHALFDGEASLISNPEAVFTFGSPHTLYLYHKEPGGLSRLVEIIESGIGYYTHISNGCGAGFEYLARAEYYLETGRLGDAEILARKAIFRAKQMRQVSLVICGNLCLARLTVLSGQPEEAVAILERLRPDVVATGNPVLINSMDIAAGYINGILGRVSGIAEWLQDGDLEHCDIFYQGMGVNYLVTGKAAILRGRHAELEAIAETMRGLYTPNNHLFGFVHAGIYDAVAKLHLYGSEKAVEALMPAIELARQDGIVTPFAEHSPHLGSILWDAVIRADSEWARTVERMSERVAESLEVSCERSRIEPLTARETEVLALLKEGLTQGEIGLRLHVSPNTVRRHLQNIYTKLEVHNMTQALNRSRRLGLL